MVVSIFHIINVLYRVYVLRVSWSMMPVIEDFKHLFDDLRYYLGLRKHKAYYGRYNYAEKVEYLAVVWGTIIMAITGFMMWNPVTTTKYLPGEFIPAAKAAHGAEAVLAVLAIIIWHFYHVHLRHFNKSMFNGKISEEEMAHEHPAELEQIKAGKADELPPPDVLRRRKRIFFPVAIVLALIFGLGLYRLRHDRVNRHHNRTPRRNCRGLCSTHTHAHALTLHRRLRQRRAKGLRRTVGMALIQLSSVTAAAPATVQHRLAVYPWRPIEDALAGGNSGPAIVPGNPDQSMLVQIQQQGGHPGQLTDEELQQVIEWIEAGAPEN